MGSYDPDHARERRRLYGKAWYRDTPIETRQDTYLRQRYGLTRKQYKKILKQQDGRCAICKRDDLPLVVDHDHETNEVRGLLCNHCNHGLGQFRDDPAIVAEAWKYLVDHDN